MAIQEIGIVLNLAQGQFSNTVYKNEKLQLTEIGVDGSGKTIYSSYGFWESQTIFINEKVASFKNVARTISTVGGAKFKVHIKTSSDGFVWTEYMEVGNDGTIYNSPDRYARVKIEIFPEKVLSGFYVDDFNDPSKHTNEFMEVSDGSLKLKKKHKYGLIKSSETMGGIIHVQTIKRNKLKKIDSLRVVVKEV